MHRFKIQLEERLPGLASLLSDAGNQSHDSRQKMTKLQLMLSIHALFMSKKKIANPDSWGIVVTKVEGMMPQFKGLVEEAANYVKDWSGTTDKPDVYLQELETFAKSLQARREPDIGQLAFLAKANLKRFPLWITACFKCLLVAARVSIPKGGSNIFTSTDIADMGETLLPTIEEAHGLMRKARDWFGDDMSLPMAAKSNRGFRCATCNAHHWL